jgi:hypothetical protein
MPAKTEAWACRYAAVTQAALWQIIGDAGIEALLENPFEHSAARSPA